MNEAIKESKYAAESKEGEPFGCVIVKNNEIIARGSNRKFIDFDASAHGEMVALRKAG
jgi:guanine deaminase